MSSYNHRHHHPWISLLFHFLFSYLKRLGKGCSNCLHYLKYQQSISTAYQQESRAVFYKRLQGKHLRPMARLEFEILTLVYDGTWCSSWLLPPFQYCRVIISFFFWRGHMVKYPDPSEQCSHSFKLLSENRVFYTLRRAVSSIYKTEKGRLSTESSRVRIRLFH